MMQEDKKYIDAKEKDDSSDTRIAKMVIWGIVGVVFIFFSSVSGCAIHSNSVQAEQTRANAEVIAAQREMRKDQHAAIIELIKRGTNPIAARCAIAGYTLSTVISSPCSKFVNTNGKQQKEELR